MTTRFPLTVNTTNTTIEELPSGIDLDLSGSDIANVGNINATTIAGNGAGLTSLTGANVTGFVANANVANSALSVDVANVTSIGNIATVNLDGSNVNVLYGNGVFAPAAGGGADSLGNLTDVTITSVTTDDVLLYDGNTWVNSPIIGNIAAALDAINGV